MGSYQEFQIQSYPNLEVTQSESVTDVSSSREIAAITGIEHSADMVKTITFDNTSNTSAVYVAFSKTSAPTATTSNRKIPAGSIGTARLVRHNYYALICASGLSATVPVTVEVESKTG